MLAETTKIMDKHNLTLFFINFLESMEIIIYKIKFTLMVIKFFNNLKIGKVSFIY